ncbi:MAG: hypothetical protein R3F11_32860 [Verrucomicrobiales bacterium]
MRWNPHLAITLAALWLGAGGGVGVALGGEPERALSFVGDVLPVLSKAGCNSSGCHTKPGGRLAFTSPSFPTTRAPTTKTWCRAGASQHIFPAAPGRACCS